MNAPISEVIIGVNIKPFVNNLPDIIQFYNKFKDRFPFFELNNPLGEFSISNNGQVQTQLKVENSGQALIRARTKDRKYLMQIQKNKFYLNWIRDDNQSLGEYPGFQDLFSMFQELINEYFDFFNVKEDVISSCDLTYHDRCDFDNLIGKVPIENILKQYKLNRDNRLLNFSFRRSEIIEELNSFSNQIIETIFKESDRLIRFEKLIQSMESPDSEIMDYKKWFKTAHIEQITSFEETFKEEVLNLWQ